jgi:hypothetical protein
MILFVLLLLVSVPDAGAKNKKKQLLTKDVVRAETVLVVIHPEAGEPLTSPRANRTAQEEVEKAIMKWGRFKLVMDAQTADLVMQFARGTRTVQRSGIRRPMTGRLVDSSLTFASATCAIASPIPPIMALADRKLEGRS